MIRVVFFAEFSIPSQLPSCIQQILFGNLLVLFELWRLACYDSFGRFPPLSVHEIWFLEFVFEEPVSVWLSCPLLHLAPYDKPFCIPALPRTGLCTLLEEGLRFGYVVDHDILCLLKTPVVGKFMNFRA